jgi:hypothetical protein
MRPAFVHVGRNFLATDSRGCPPRSKKSMGSEKQIPRAKNKALGMTRLELRVEING